MGGNGYLIPANSKKGQLILNFFRPIDLIIFGVGVSITFILLMFVSLDQLWKTILVLVPAATVTVLVAPIPNYHNVLVFITSLYQYLTNRRNYIWKGWCMKDGNDK